MTYQTLQDYNITGSLDKTIVLVNNNVPIFTPILLLSIFFIITAATWYGTRKMSGNADFFASATVGSFITTLIAIMMTLTPGIISGDVLAICVILTTVMLIFFFFSRER